MIYLAGFFFSFLSVSGTIIFLEGRKDKKAQIIADRIKVLKSKRLIKKFERWADADKIIESLKIESE